MADWPEAAGLGGHATLEVLPDGLSRDSQALERLGPEARAASLLSRPGGSTIHDVGEHGGRPFVVMKLLKGRTLKHRLDVWVGPAVPQGAQPAAWLRMDTLPDPGIQVAPALDAAYPKRMIHRNTEPANSFVTRRGQARILTKRDWHWQGQPNSSPLLLAAEQLRQHSPSSSH